jgi:hypothetical protein
MKKLEKLSPSSRQALNDLPHRLRTHFIKLKSGLISKRRYQRQVQSFNKLQRMYEDSEKKSHKTVEKQVYYFLHKLCFFALVSFTWFLDFGNVFERKTIELRDEAAICNHTG